MANGNFGGGTGEINTPYLIEDLSDLVKLSDYGSWCTTNTYFKLVNDIDASQAELLKIGRATWEPIPTPTAATQSKMIAGVDFNFKKVKNLYINKPLADYVGFFSNLNTYQPTGGAIIRRARFTDAKIVGRNYVGILAGAYSYGGGVIQGVSAEGEVNGNNYVGGIVGYISGVNFQGVQDSKFEGVIDGGTYVGGICGSINYGPILRCISEGEIYGVSYVGGILGNLMTNTGSACSDCASLCESITRKYGTATTFGRVVGSYTTVVPSNNIAREGMLFRY